MTNLSLIRDLKLGIATGDYKVTTDLNKLGNKYYFLNKKRKIVKDLLDRGISKTSERYK